MSSGLAWVLHSLLELKVMRRSPRPLAPKEKPLPHPWEGEQPGSEAWAPGAPLFRPSGNSCPRSAVSDSDI